MEFELPKINVSFEYDEEKDEIVFVINGVEKRVKTEDIITEMEKSQEQNTALEQQPCDDCISRADAIQAMNNLYEQDCKYYGCAIPDCFDSDTAIIELKSLPSVQPKPKTGHWIKTISENGVTSAVRCSECGFEDNRYMLFRYCPYCGAKMDKHISGKEK